jgi:glycosyltransferase involved in cell wall biosynthesis
MVVSPKDDSNKLNRCLKSLINQSMNVKQIVIVGNGLLPTSLNQILDKFKDESSVYIFKNEKTLPLGLALNLGLKNVSTEWVLRIDPDDISLIDRVKDAAAHVESSDFDLAFFSNYEIGGRNEPIFKRVIPRDFSAEKFLFFNPVVHSTALIRKNSLKEVGGYKNIFLAEDYELWLRLILNKKQIKFFPNFAVIYDTEGLAKRRRSLNTIIGEKEILLIKNKIRSSSRVLNYLVFLLRIAYRVSPPTLISFFYAKFISRRLEVDDPIEKSLIEKYL